MYVVATLFRGVFWTLFTFANSERQAQHYAQICSRSRGESVKIMERKKWDMEADARKVSYQQTKAAKRS